MSETSLRSATRDARRVFDVAGHWGLPSDELCDVNGGQGRNRTADASLFRAVYRIAEAVENERIMMMQRNMRGIASGLV